jgi:hypothetical protein
VEAWQIHEAAQSSDEIPVFLRVFSPDFYDDVKFMVPYPAKQKLVVFSAEPLPILDYFRLRVFPNIHVQRAMSVYLEGITTLATVKAPFLAVSLTFSERAIFPTPPTVEKS